MFALELLGFTLKTLEKGKNNSKKNNPNVFDKHFALCAVKTSSFVKMFCLKSKKFNLSKEFQ